MKKIYFSMALFALTFNVSKAQLSLTKAFNEAVVGDKNTKQSYDSTTAIPKATGSGINWNFTSLTSNTLIEVSTYTTVASTPSAALFPNATLAEDQGNGDYTFIKSTSTTYEIQGLQFPGVAVNFSNTAVFATWPINFGYNATDAFGGSTTSGTMTISFSGNANVMGAGTGTVVMPGGLTLTNCLQVIGTYTIYVAQGAVTQTIVQKEYSYYHSSNKFPVLTINYESATSGTITTKTFGAWVNTSIVGIASNESNISSLSVFPNPAKDMINISFDNSANNDVKIVFTNMIGQVVKNENPGNSNTLQAKIDVSSLPKGIYLMKVSAGNASTIKKVVIN